MSEFMDALRRADHDMRRAEQTPTHWLMSEDARDRLRYENTTMLMVDCHGGGQHEEFMGYRIYIDRSLPEGAWSLGTGTAPDTVREDDLRFQMDKLYRQYRQAAEPLIKEMAEIESRKPSRPITIDDMGQIKSMSHVRQNLVAPRTPEGA